MKGLPHHEDIVARTPYDVMAWWTYLEDVDEMIADVASSSSAAGSVGNKLKKKNNTKGNNRNDDDDNDNSSQKSLTGLVELKDMVGRRAVHLLPRSYKLWKIHWEFVVAYRHHLGGPQTVLRLFERALVTLHKFPRVWMEYLEFTHGSVVDAVVRRGGGFSKDDDTRTNLPPGTNESTVRADTTSTTSSTSYILHPTQLRRLVSRALEALPITQHDKIWPIVVKYYQTSNASSPMIPKETKLSLLRRYIQFYPAAIKDVADFFADELGHWGEAALLYVELLNNNATSAVDLPMSLRKDLWMSLAKICTRHPVEVEIGIDFEGMVRAMLATIKATRSRGGGVVANAAATGSATQYLPADMEGILWSQLADAWIRRGEFQLARSVYEEALESVSTVRDFTILLDAYLQFEEGLLEATMEGQPDDEMLENDGEGAVRNNNDDDNDWDILLPQDDTNTSSMSDLELALARAEDLTARRPILLNRVLLRQNPDDVGEWLNQARLFKETDQLHQAAAALEEGLRTVKARRAVGGNPNQMVLQLVMLYETDFKDVMKARNLLDRICNQWMYEFKNVDDLAECFTAWVEMELREESWDDALDIIRSSVVVPPNAPRWVRGLTKSLRLWDLLLDLEESLGTVQSTKDAYNCAIEEKVATPLHILNFATFLAEQKYFEESFTAYERGVELFDFPGVKVIWKAYLDAFLKRYGGTKLERTRDLFQRCLDACPPEASAEFFLMNGAFEEEHGLTKRALGVYKTMCQTVPLDDRYTAYQLFIVKTAKYLGQTATRDIYQSAIQDLEDNPAARLCLDFANMETSLQEIDRARAVLTYGAQMADPRRNQEYWRAWNEFEISHGNEETFREMLRIKRSVEASFSTVNYNAAEMSGSVPKSGEALSNEDALKMIAEREGVELDQQTHTALSSGTLSGFVSSKRSAQAASLEDVEERVAKLRKATAAMSGTADSKEGGDEDEIDIDEESEEEVGGEEEGYYGDKAGKDRVEDVKTRAVPAAVFGGLIDGDQQGSQ